MSTFALLSQAVVGIAQTAPVGDLQRVEIDGQLSDGRKDSTVSKIIVRKDDLSRFGDSTLSDVLRRLPSVSVTSPPGSPPEIRFRGLGSGYVQLQIDGEPVPAGFSFDSIAPDLIERIELVRSPTAESGAQAVAGTINIVLKLAKERSRQELSASMGIERKEASPSIGMQLAYGSSSHPQSLVVKLAQQRNDKRSTIEEFSTDSAGLTQQEHTLAERYVSRSDSVDATHRVSWNQSDFEQVAVSTFGRFAKTYVGGAQRTDDVIGTSPQFGSTDWHTSASATTFRSDLEWKRQVADDSSASIRAGINDFRKVLHTRFDSRDMAGTAALLRSVHSSSNDLGLTTAGRLRSGVVDGHAMVLGWDGGISQRVESRRQDDVAFSDVRAVNLDESFDARVTRIAAFAQDEWDVSPRLSAYAGLRWEGLETHSSASAQATVRNRSGVVSPLVQMLWKLPDSATDQVRLSISRTYKAPVTADLMPRQYIVIDNTPNNPDTQGNPTLRPELAWGADFAYERHLPRGAGMFSVGAYARQIDDVIRQRLYRVNEVWISQPVNDGAADVAGLELEAKGAVDKILGFDRLPLDYRLNLTRNWSRVSAAPGPNNRLDQQMPLAINIGLDWRSTRDLSLGANWNYQGGGAFRRSLSESGFNDPQRLLDFYVSWIPQPSFRLKFTVANALHQPQASGKLYTTESGSIGQRLTQQSATSLRVLAELKL